MDQNSEFTGWAVVEVMGHNRYSGFVTTQAFGSVVMFKIHAPAVEPVEQVLDQERYINHSYVPAGSKLRVSRPEFCKYVGAGSVYAMTPCTEETALMGIPQVVEVVELAERKALGPVTVRDNDDDDEGGTDPDDYPY